MDISGVIVAVLTPYNSESSVDFPVLEEHLSYLLEAGVGGFFMCGTAGEGILLDPEERKKIVECAVRIVNGKVPVIAHVGHLEVEIAADLAKHAKAAGADAVASIPPYYFPLDDEALLQYFKKVGEAASPLPLFVYNYPDVTNNSITTNFIEKLAAVVPNLKGIKDSSKNIRVFESFMNLPLELSGIIGSDSLILEALRLNGCGVVSTVANVFPKEVVEIYRSYQNGDEDRAVECQSLVNKLRHVLKLGPYISTYKEALTLLGHRFGGVRAPLRAMEDEERDHLKQALLEVEELRQKVIS